MAVSSHAIDTVFAAVIAAIFSYLVGRNAGKEAAAKEYYQNSYDRLKAQMLEHAYRALVRHYEPQDDDEIKP